MLHHPSLQLHHSSVLFCTISQHSSAPFISTVAQFVSTVLHHSSAQFFTIRQFSSAPFVSYCSAPFVFSVLHHSSCYCTIILPHRTILHHTIFCITDANTPARLFNCIVEILVLATAAYRTFCPTCRRIYSTVEIQLHYTSVKSMFFCPAAELLVNSAYYRHLIVALWSTPFMMCISALLCLHFRIC